MWQSLSIAIWPITERCHIHSDGKGQCWQLCRWLHPSCYPGIPQRDQIGPLLQGRSQCEQPSPVLSLLAGRDFESSWVQFGFSKIRIIRVCIIMLHVHSICCVDNNNYIIGASLSEPHTYRTAMKNSPYIYIRIRAVGPSVWQFGPAKV